MASIVRVLSEDASVVATAIDATDIVSEIERIHQTSAVDAFDCLSSGQTPCPQPTTP